MLKSYILIFISINSVLLTYNSSCISYKEFKQKFNLENITTEQHNKKTMRLSHKMHKNIEVGLENLISVDEELISTFENKIDNFSKNLVPHLQKCLKNNGRIFLVGSGTSGRIAINLAAKINNILSNKEKIIGIIAGGDSAMVKAKEGVEDSQIEGEITISKFNPNKKDIVILISSSGTANFNVGCGNFASNSGAKVFYFYNSKNIPEKTSKLFNKNKNPIIPLFVNIGAQAITGSTRLQAATAAMLFLGYSFKIAITNRNESKLLIKKLKESIKKIKLNFKDIKKIIIEEVEILSNPLSNFRRLKNYSNQGYITMLATENCVKEVFIDSTEIPPTFSTNSMKKESEKNKKIPEFQTYLISNDNKDAWENLLSKKIEDKNTISEYLIATKAIGNNSYLNRPKNKGNIVFGISTLNNNESINELNEYIKKAKSNNATTIVLLISNQIIDNNHIKNIKNNSKIFIKLENIEDDELEIIQSFTIKIILNLISNSTMILMNKVYGNKMIDLNPSNYKLINRMMRIIKEIWNNKFPKKPINDEILYNYINTLYEEKKDREAKGYYTPPIANIILNLLYKNENLDNINTVINKIIKNKESLSFLNIK